jgi:DNA-binding response OmpR family regulator
MEVAFDLLIRQRRNALDSPLILYADDDYDSQQSVCLVLEEAGMNVVFAENGSRALDLWHKHPIDVVVLDVMMPDLDGLETCRLIRRESSVPVILLTARGREEDVLAGFNSGADDYIVKPFRPRELVARIGALLRRSTGRSWYNRKQLAFDNLILDLESRCVIQRDRQVEVSPMEFRLLKYLMQNAGNVVSKEDLLHDVWGYAASSGDMNLIEATIRRLRQKVESDPSRPRYIQTVWGAGYRFGD